MGLDMYLYAEKYLESLNKHRHLINRPNNSKPAVIRYDYLDISDSNSFVIQRDFINISKASSIQYQVMYWRKAYPIHEWFVKNIQNDVDNCATYFVSIDDLKYLKEICKKIVCCDKLSDEKFLDLFNIKIHKNESDIYLIYNVHDLEEKIKDHYNKFKYDIQKLSREYLPTSVGGNDYYDENYLNYIIFPTIQGLVKIFLDPLYKDISTFSYNSSW